MPYRNDAIFICWGCFTTLSFMCTIAASRTQEAFQTGDAHHGSIGEMFATWWNWHNCFLRHSSLHSHLWKACHKELWNHQSNHRWKWKLRNNVWDRGRPTVDFGLVHYVIYLSSQFDTGHDSVLYQFRDGMFRLKRQLRWNCFDFLHGLHRPWLP